MQAKEICGKIIRAAIRNGQLPCIQVSEVPDSSFFHRNQTLCPVRDSFRMFQPLQLKASGGIAAAVEEILLREHIIPDPAQVLAWYFVIKPPVLPETQHGITKWVVIVRSSQKWTL